MAGRARGSGTGRAAELGRQRHGDLGNCGEGGKEASGKRGLEGDGGGRSGFRRRRFQRVRVLCCELVLGRSSVEPD